MGPVDSWLSSLFGREYRDRTIAALLAAQPSEDTDTRRTGLRQRITAGRYCQILCCVLNVKGRLV